MSSRDSRGQRTTDERRETRATSSHASFYPITSSCLSFLFLFLFSIMSSSLVWAVVNKQNAFLKKQRHSGGALFSSEAGNITARHGYSSSGLVKKVETGSRADLKRQASKRFSRKAKASTRSVKEDKSRRPRRGRK